MAIALTIAKHEAIIDSADAAKESMVPILSTSVCVHEVDGGPALGGVFEAERLR